jgi:hypothetical protein
LEPPGGHTTIIRTGFTGYACASAAGGANSNEIAAAASQRQWTCLIVLLLGRLSDLALRHAVKSMPQDYDL